jgi:formylglycine-generating enzyme required for sulfatase activity
LADHSLRPAWYVAVVRKPGYETVAIPFHVDHAAEHFAACAALELRLLPIGTTPPGFVRIAAEAYTWGEQGCFMQEREVTCREFCAFLDAGADPALLPASDGWELQDGRPAFAGGAERLDEPVVGVSWHAAVAFAAWCDDHWQRPPGHHFALPTAEQWVRAAKGGDGRPYVFGAEFRIEWVRSAGAVAGRPEPVMSHPYDESPWGIFDLCGNAAEWCDDDGDVVSAPVGGGSWRDHHAAAFRVAERRVDKDVCDDAIGFRLVLVPGVGDGR